MCDWMYKYNQIALLFHETAIQSFDMHQLSYLLTVVVKYLTYQTIFPPKLSSISRVPKSIYSPRHWAGAGGPAVTIGTDGTSP